MNNGFRRLRIAAAVGLAGSMVAPAVPKALAVGTGAIPLPFKTGQRSAGSGSGVFSARGTGWTLANDASGPFATPSAGPIRGLGVEGGSWTSKLVTSTAGHPLGSSRFSTVETQAFRAFGLVSIKSHVYADPDGAVDVSHDGPGYAAALSTPATVGGLKTHVRYDFLGRDGNGNGIVRLLITVHNPSRRTRARTVQVGSLLGTAGSTDIHSSSDGNTTYDSDDAWVSFGSAGTHPGTALVRGDGNGDVLSDTSGIGSAVDGYPLRTRAHKSAVLLYFAVVGKNGSTVTASMDQFTNATALEASHYIDDLDASMRSRIKNWKF